jgi:hypothetical protein
MSGIKKVVLQNLGKLEWDDSSREDMTTAPLMKKM